MDNLRGTDAAALAQSRLIERLVESEQTLRDILTNLPVIVVRFSKNNNGKILFLNSAWKRILGFEINSCMGEEIDSYVLYDDLKKWNQLLAQSREEQEKLVYKDNQIRFKDSKQQIRWLRIKIEQRKNGEIIALMEDFTERRRLDADLIQAQRLESIGHLAGGLAHDFNNLLQVIMGYIDLTKRVINKKGIDTNYLEIASEACIRAAGLSKQMLTFSKGGEPVRKAGSLEEVLQEALTMNLHGSNFKADIKLEPHLPQVNMDYGQIHQVLNNVILNAKQAMSEGGKLNVELRRDKKSSLRSLDITSDTYKDKEMVVIEIQDSGTGIKSTDLEKIYDPYFTTKKSGTGLGLTSAYWIIKKHDGDLLISSEQDKGTTVQISLPAMPPTIGLDPSPQKEQKLAKSLNIMVMDDEEIILSSLKLMLENFGHKVTSTNHGEECLNAYVETLNGGGQFDMIILDLTNSKGKGGLWTIKQILKLKPSAKFIAASGYSSNNDLSNYKQNGFSAVLQKPFGTETLSKCLNDVLSI